jgi:hypothetical protein
MPWSDDLRRFPILRMAEMVTKPGFAFSGRAIADAKREIAEALQPYDAVQALAALLLVTLFGDGEDYSEPERLHNAAVEYIAVVLLERKDPTGKRAMTAAQTQAASAAVTVALDNAQLIGLQTTFMRMASADDTRDPVQSLATRLALMDASIRGQGYEHQAVAFLRGATAEQEVATVLKERIGFDSDDALRLERATRDLVSRRYNEERQTLLAITRDPREYVWQMYRRGEYILTVTGAELAAEAEMPQLVADAFLENLSIEFGAIRSAHPFSDGVLVRDRPFIANGRGGFLLTSSVNILWRLRPLFEETLIDSPVWETYQRTRSSVVERMTVDPLADALRADEKYSRLHFSINSGALFEIDGLLILDHICFVLEAKSVRLNVSARRGRKGAVIDALERLVGKGSTQALRLAEAIATKQSITFYEDRAGTQEVAVDLGGVSAVETFVVSLDDVAWLIGADAALVEIGLWAQGSPRPWVVGAFDLEIIARTLEFPGQLITYLQRRRETNVEGAGDELNLWMLHMLHRVEFPQDGRVVLQGDWTKEIDRHFMFGLGSIPRMPLHSGTRRAVARADGERRPGHLAATASLIDEDQATRPPSPARVLETPAGRKLYIYANEG